MELHNRIDKKGMQQEVNLVMKSRSKHVDIRVNECSTIPFYDIYRSIIEDLRDINMWSFEYIATTFTRSLKLSNACRIDANLELRKIAEKVSKYYERNHAGTLISRVNNYLQEVANALCSLEHDVRELQVELNYRGNIGVSSGFGQLLFEWGISFDPYLNLPYIPASSIKGAVRTAYKYLCTRYSRNKEDCNNKVEEIFGSSTKGAGLVMFTDAYPVDLRGNAKYILIPDVVTPHYNSEELRYEKEVEPNPVVHLSLSKAVIFKFLMYYRPRNGRRINYDNDLVEDPSSISSTDDLRLIDKAVFLAFGLGVGAKTLTGYSQFKIVSYRRVCRG